MTPSFRYSKDYNENFYYEIAVFMSTLGKEEPFDFTEQIVKYDLNEARQEAIKRFNEIQKGILDHGTYFLPFASPADFVKGKNACFSISLSFVSECDGEVEKYVLHGEDEVTHKESLEFERQIINELRYKQFD